MNDRWAQPSSREVPSHLSTSAVKARTVMKPIAAACPTILLLLGACSVLRPEEANPSKPAPAAAPVTAPASAPAVKVTEPNPSPPSSAQAVASGGHADSTRNTPSPAKNASPPASSAAGGELSAKSNVSPSRPASRPAPAEPASAAGAKQPVANPPAQRAAAPPTLDIAALEQRLKDTHAIGLFTKLSLKNQVDDLLAQFRAHFHGNGSPPLSDLRQRYDLLMLKVLSLLQDGDPPLAQTIGSSREAIWGILTDPNKLAAISS
jgi:hypothetical protein